MSSYVGRIGPKIKSGLGKWAYDASGFNKLGLYRDDCFYENEDVKEAIRRLPKKLYDERHFRILRALHCSMTKTILPRSEWPTYETDVKYLEPYLNEVIKERLERQDWEDNK